MLVGRAIATRRAVRGRDVDGRSSSAARAAARSTSSACSPTATCTRTSITSRRCSTAAAKAGCKQLYVHALLDGRDVPPTSALEYVDRTERFLAGLRAESGVDARIVSGGGRMTITMDRYEADWAMVERGWHTHVLADARAFASATEAIETFRAEHPGIIDQDLPPFVVAPRDADRRRRRGRDVQLPRRSRDRDLARVRRRRASTSSIACAGPTSSTPG